WLFRWLVTRSTQAHLFTAPLLTPSVQATRTGGHHIRLGLRPFRCMSKTLVSRRNPISRQKSDTMTAGCFCASREPDLSLSNVGLIFAYPHQRGNGMVSDTPSCSPIGGRDV